MADEVKTFVFTWYNHATRESGKSEPVRITESEARNTLRQAIASDFSPFVTRSFKEVRLNEKET